MNPRWITIAALTVIAFHAAAQTPPQSAPPTTGASAQLKLHPLRNVAPREAFAYFSGNAQSNHNHPAMYAYQGDIQKVVVVGRGYREEFPISQIEQAFKAYSALLKRTGYKIDDRENGRSPLMRPADRGK